MSILASKMIAINIVDMEDGHRPIADVQVTEKDTRVAMLEAQVNELKQWRASFTPSSAAKAYSSASETASAPGSPHSFTSLDSSDLPQIESTRDSLSEKVEPQKKSNLPAKKNSSSKPNTDVTSRIMTIIQGYGQNEENADGEAWLGRIKFEPRVRKHVDAGIPVDLVLPAFPWKSVNKVEKVVGAIPDLGEEMGLGRLQNLCDDIGAIYAPGAYVTVASDGLVYNDLLGISDEEVYEYGIHLRQMAAEKGYDRLKFIRIMNLLGLTDSPHMTKEEYLGYVTDSRKTLVEKYLDPAFDAREAILNDADINM